MKARKRIALMLALVLACLPLSAWGQEATQAEAVTLEGEEISSLAFLAENTNLQTLTLYNCPAVDLSPLASCKKLTTLTIAWDETYAGGTAYDLAPLANCTRLHSLMLKGACVNDLTALADLQTLSTLSVSGLAAEDYTSIAKLPLSHLLLSGTPAEQVAAIFSVLGRQLNSAVLGNCALTPEASAAVLQSTHLTSLRFEGVSGLATNAAAWSRLANLSSLQMDGCTLDSLDFLSNYVSTVIIKLENCTVNGTVCGVAFDKYFLETNNLPADTLLALLQSDGCQWLYATIRAETETVSGAVIARLGEIGSLLSVKVQNVSADAWADACWSGFDKLEQLTIANSEAVDAACLRKLSTLQRLTISHADVAGAETFAKLPVLMQLSLIACTLDDWDFLQTLTGLTLLTAAGCNGPASLDFVQSLPSLASLALESAPITDLSPLTGRSLESLYLYGCSIADYAPLTALSRLTLLSCNADAALPPLTCRVLRQAIIDLE